MLMLGHAGVQAPRRDARNRMFHVKPYAPRVAEHTCMFYDRGECSSHTCMGIAEPQEVGHEVSQRLQI